ncbi:uncharacterized protein LOC134528900 [Bacillus rossius redtenbacheri]|uniref:uncharacterized protein LOC134528900 n=1 Tax=Bacillus rossius redtenbacheri TaxID=93214 RepID=UPI002FDEB104
MPRKFVLRYVHRLTPLDFLQQELATANLPVQNFWFLENRQCREKCDALVIEVPQSCDPNRILLLKEFASMAIRVDDYRRPSGPSQCSKCQQFNHVRKGCRAAPVCRWYSCPHRAPDGPLAGQQEHKKCAHCQEQHCANYKGCSEYKKESCRHLPQVRKAREQQSRRDIRENRRAATHPAPQQRTPPGFFGPPGSQPWGPTRHTLLPGFTQYTNNRFDALTHHSVPSYNELDYPVFANNPWQRRLRPKQQKKNWTGHKNGNGRKQHQQQQPTHAAPTKENPAAAPRRVTSPAAAQIMVVDTAPVSPPPPPTPTTDTQVPHLEDVQSILLNNKAISANTQLRSYIGPLC